MSSKVRYKKMNSAAALFSPHIYFPWIYRKKESDKCVHNKM
jgi:hypothetical protein